MLPKKTLPTYYAPAERATEDELAEQIKLFQTNDKLEMLLSKIPVVIFIINKYRQIIYMSHGALEFSGLSEFASAEGQRPGELFGCVHARSSESGCGTTPACTYCGAVNAVLESQKKGTSVKDAHLILGPEEKAFDLRIWASQLMVDGQEFTMVTIQDISDEKRRRILEEIFMHDISNIATVLLGKIELMNNKNLNLDCDSYLDNLEMSAKILVDEISSHRILNAAEKGSLQLTMETFNTIDLLDELIQFYITIDLTKEKRIIIDSEAVQLTITSDRTLVYRILSNMVKNALEAINSKQSVTLGCDERENEVELWVHNPGYMPKRVQLQVFQRYFSTKGKNRGLGTYGMKLLSSYLKGKVEFISSKEKGTKFRLLLPRTK